MNNYTCICTNGYYGSNCQYKQLNSTIFKNSTILTNELSLQLVNLTGFSFNSSWSLLYQASVDSFRASSFHSKCDQISNTLTVIKSKKYNFIFGGFTTAQWNQNTNSYITDTDAFLFSLVNAYNTSVKMLPNNPSIYSHYNQGPTFGYGHDIYLPDNSNLVFGYTYIYSYQSPSFVTDRNSFLAGSYNFLADEIEVYEFNGK